MKFRHLLMVVAVSFFTVFLTIGFILGGLPPMAKGAQCPHRADDAGKAPCGNGDVNGDGERNVADAIYLLGYLFNKGPMPYALADDDRIPVLEAQVAALTQRVTAVETEQAARFPDLTQRLAAVEAEQANRKPLLDDLATHGPLLDDLEFGKKIAGVYSRGFPGGGELMSIHADGSCLYLNSWQSNEDNPDYPGGYFIPGWYGTWTKTGEYSIRIDTWTAKRRPYVGGEHFWDRLVFDNFDISDDFERVRFNGRWVEAELPTNVDPSTCDAPWGNPDGGAFVGAWLSRLPVCPLGK